jgi:hypothetical protein
MQCTGAIHPKRAGHGYWWASQTVGFMQGILKGEVSLYH